MFSIYVANVHMHAQVSYLAAIQEVSNSQECTKYSFQCRTLSDVFNGILDIHYGVRKFLCGTCRVNYCHSKIWYGHVYVFFSLADFQGIFFL